jgi:hypothetical protein
MDIIQSEHIKKRCYFIYAMCTMSLYSWYNYSVFDLDPNSANSNIHFFTPYYQNCLLMLFYLGWDTYHMTLSKHRKILYRKDLVIHHFFATISYVSFINITPLQLSNSLIMECISAMNSVLKNNARLLKLYRTFCIFFVRMPLSLWYCLYYIPYYKKIMFPNNNSNDIFKVILSTTLFIFFIFYDVFILRKLYKPNKIQQ